MADYEIVSAILTSEGVAKVPLRYFSATPGEFRPQTCTSFPMPPQEQRDG